MAPSPLKMMKITKHHQQETKDGPPSLIRCNEEVPEPLNCVDETLIELFQDEEKEKQQLLQRKAASPHNIRSASQPPTVLPLLSPSVKTPTNNINPTSNIDGNNSKGNAPTADEVMDFLVRQQMQHEKESPRRPPPQQEEQPQAVSKTGSFFLPESKFVDNQELQRNVRYDLVTNRCYVYTTDMSSYGLPELLYLNVPNDTTLTSLCGWHITNRFGNELLEKIVTTKFPSQEEDHAEQEKGSNRGCMSKARRVVRDRIIRERNLSIYQVDVVVPSKTTTKNSKHDPVTPHLSIDDSTCIPEQKHKSNNRRTTKTTKTTTPTTTPEGESITLGFRIRVVPPKNKIYMMLSSNFLNCHVCPHGIVVLIPCMSYQDSRDYWGTMDQTQVKDLPTSDVYISSSRIDSYCKKLAKYHGTYRGDIPVHCQALLDGSSRINNSSLLDDDDDIPATPPTITITTTTPTSKNYKKKSKKRKSSPTKQAQEQESSPKVFVAMKRLLLRSKESAHL
jgi:hypothetical protein